MRPRGVAGPGAADFRLLGRHLLFVVAVGDHDFRTHMQSLGFTESLIEEYDRIALDYEANPTIKTMNRDER